MNIATVTESLELYKLLEYDNQSKALFQVIADIIASFEDGKLDINQIVNTISSKSPEELQELVAQAQIIIDQVSKVTRSMAV